MKHAEISPARDVMKESNEGTVVDETVNVNVCMIEVERCELNHQEESYQERVCLVEKAKGPEHSIEERVSNEDTKERVCKGKSQCHQI